MTKRIVDIIGSAILLLLFSPIILIVSILVAISMGRPVLFNQPRPGLHGRIFYIHKFRTMTDVRGPDGNLLPDPERTTRLGRLLRSTSLDELPEFFNVLKGDMSLVGPRPLLPEYQGRYTPEQARRHEVRPGITGLAQVSGRHDIPFSKRLELDVYYVDHHNLWMDLKILAATVPKVLGHKGVRNNLSIDDIDDIGICPVSAVGRKRGAGEQVE